MEPTLARVSGFLLGIILVAGQAVEIYVMILGPVSIQENQSRVLAAHVYQDSLFIPWLKSLGRSLGSGDEDTNNDGTISSTSPRFRESESIRETSGFLTLRLCAEESKILQAMGRSQARNYPRAMPYARIK